MVKAQEWLDREYPREGRKDIKVLDINNKNLEGKLDLNDFINLEKLWCWDNQLTNLDVFNCSNLIELWSHQNQLINLVLSKSNRLEILNININNLSKQDLSLVNHLTNLYGLYLQKNHFVGSLKPLENMTRLRWLNIISTNINDGLEYLPKSLERIYCADWCAKQLKDYIKKDESNFIYYDFRAWRKNNLYSYLINKVENKDKELSTKDQLINSLQHQLTGNQTIINNLQGELTAWQCPIFWPQPTLGQPDSVVTFRTQINSFDVLGTAGLCLLTRHLYRKYRNSRQRVPLDEERQPLLRSPEEIAKLNQETNRLKSELNQIARIISPNEEPRADVLKQEITRLKHQELASQVREEKTKFEQLITATKTKASNSEKTIDSLLEAQKQKEQATENSQKDKLSGKIEAYQSILEGNLTKEELQTLLTKQTELSQLEKHLESLQQNQAENLQEAQILQPAYGTPGSSKGGNN